MLRYPVSKCRAARGGWWGFLQHLRLDVFIDPEALCSPLSKKVLDAQVSHTTPERSPKQGPEPQVAFVPEGRKAAPQPLDSIFQHWVGNINI